jgi:uncharacterized cofD-like protein
MMPTQTNAQERGLNVVAIGGGTGLSTLLKGLKRHVPITPAVSPSPEPPPPALSPQIENLTAVVTVTDDGGSSGRLRREFKILPPGDIRNCMVAMSEDEALLGRLFQYRFSAGEGLEGHNFGNLFLTAMSALTGGDFALAVRHACDILAVRGHIYPSTTSHVQLVATMDDGTRVEGETKITASDRRIVRLELVPEDATPLPETLKAIAAADVITIGPGSLFTSLVTNLLVRGVVDAIAASPAIKVYICNLMTQANESLGFSASDHIRELSRHAGQKLFDYALLNGATLPMELAAKYALEGATQIPVDAENVRALGVEPIVGDYLASGPVARHAGERVAKDLLGLVKKLPNCRTAELPN